MATFVIAGGTGFVGSHLHKILQSMGHTVYVLSTRTKDIPFSKHLIYWDTEKGIIDDSFHIKNAHVINLAGAGVADKRWTEERKKEIVQSRLSSLYTLEKAIQKGQIEALHLCSASAIGYYGFSQGLLQETHTGDDSFLSTTCKKWEEAAWSIAEMGVPTSIARIGVVLGKEGGALPALTNSMKWGIAGKPGSGQQIYSWIHLHDVCRMLYFLSIGQKVGIYNAVSPYPVPLSEVIKQIRKYAYPYSIPLPAPEWAIKVLLGEMSTEVLKSTQVSAHKILTEGFDFFYPTIEACISHLYHK